MIIKKLLKKLREFGKKKLQTKVKKKAKKKLKKLIRKLVGTAIVCFGLVMVYKYRRPIAAAIIGKKLPIKKCPILKKR